jgi:hypothetical protein
MMLRLVASVLALGGENIPIEEEGTYDLFFDLTTLTYSITKS